MLVRAKYHLVFGRALVSDTDRGEGKMHRKIPQPSHRRMWDLFIIAVRNKLYYRKCRAVERARLVKSFLMPPVGDRSASPVRNARSGKSSLDNIDLHNAESSRASRTKRKRRRKTSFFAFSISSIPCCCSTLRAVERRSRHRGTIGVFPTLRAQKRRDAQKRGAVSAAPLC